jgi:hypothetical protein
MHTREMCSYLNLQRITSSSSQIISELERPPVNVNWLGLVLRIKMPSFHPHKEWLLIFHPTNKGLQNHWDNKSSRWYQVLTSRLLMKPRLKVTGCNLQLNNQLEHSDSHKGWLHKRQSPLPKGLLRMRSSLWGACKVLWEDNFSIA